MTATSTFDVFSSVDGYGSTSGDGGGYWGEQGPELLDHRLAVHGAEQRTVFGATTSTVVSTTLEGPLDWPDATVVGGDAVDVVARLEELVHRPTPHRPTLHRPGRIREEDGTTGRRR